MSPAATAGSVFHWASRNIILPISGYVSAWRIASMRVTWRHTFSPPPSA